MSAGKPGGAASTGTKPAGFALHWHSGYVCGAWQRRYFEAGSGHRSGRGI